MVTALPTPASPRPCTQEVCSVSIADELPEHQQTPVSSWKGTPAPPALVRSCKPASKRDQVCASSPLLKMLLKKVH
jgi:hypothetical protein